MAELADHAYAHAVAVLGPTESALTAAMNGVRRGGRSRSAVLAHARAEVLSRPARPSLAAEPAPDDLTDLADALASTRDPLEQVIVDLDTRHGLDRGELARALGVSAADAAERANATAARWQHDLDPALLARLGPGGCDELAAVLATAGLSPDAADDGESEGAQPTVAALLDAGALVRDHAETCETCRDRLRAMVSVRALVGHRSIERAPREVRAAGMARFRWAPIPAPPLEPSSPGRPRRAGIRALALVVVVLLVGAAGLGVAISRRTPHTTARLAALTSVPAGRSSVRLDPVAVVAPAPEPVRVINASGATLRWQAASDVAWLRASPGSGRLGPRESETFRLIIATTAPEGDVHGTVTVTASDGSTAVLRIGGVVEHPPDVSVDATGCAVKATVEDESGINGVALHWIEHTGRKGAPIEKSLLMKGGDAGYEGVLPAGVPEPLTWWVSAVDGRGNLARTPDQRLDAGTC